MKLPELEIKNISSRFPIIQAGMGVRVGTGKLAGSIINAGGMGVIASVGLGDYDDAEGRNYAEESNHRLIAEIKEAREITGGKGPLGVNVMVALTNYETLVRTAIEEGIDFIISGAGLPLKLPNYVKKDTVLIPVVSSGRALALILKTWKKRFDRIPDALILEGPLCGGHLGFTYEQIDHPETCTIENIYSECKGVLDKEGIDIPLIAAEGVATKEDIERMLRVGYAGVQIGTRFICLEESGMDRRGQEVYVNATKDDVVVIKSPVGMPVRVLKSPLVNRVLSGKREQFRCPFRCLIPCDMKKVSFCLAQALLSARAGDVENGIFMTGCNVEAITEITSVEDYFSSLEEREEE